MKIRGGTQCYVGRTLDYTAEGQESLCRIFVATGRFGNWFGEEVLRAECVPLIIYFTGE